MPTFGLTTNVHIADRKAFAIKFSKLCAETTEKPELYVSVKIDYNETLTFNGTFEPAFNFTIVSLDNIDHQKNEKYSKVFFDFFKKELGIPGERGYIHYVDPGRENLAYAGATFITHFGPKK